MLSASNISHSPKGWSDMDGRPIENLSHDQSIRNKGHPRIADLSVCNTHALHIARYVAAKTAEPQLLRLMCSGNVASAISCAKGMYSALIVLTWFSVNITLPKSHMRYASKLRLSCSGSKSSGYSGNFWTYIHGKQIVSITRM